MEPGWIAAVAAILTLLILIARPERKFREEIRQAIRDIHTSMEERKKLIEANERDKREIRKRIEEIERHIHP